MLKYETAPAKAGKFELVWLKILHRLAPGAVIRLWGAARGYTGGKFKIEHVDRWSVTVFGGHMRMPRRFPKGDFVKFYDVWGAYCAGDFPRAQMTSLSHNTTYILSVLHSVAAA